MLILGILVLLGIVYAALYLLVIAPLYWWSEYRRRARLEQRLEQLRPASTPAYNEEQSTLIAAYKKQMKLTRPLTKGELAALIRAAR